MYPVVYKRKKREEKNSRLQFRQVRYRKMFSYTRLYHRDFATNM